MDLDTKLDLDTFKQDGVRSNLIRDHEAFKLHLALVKANSALRSAYAVAAREGRDTNWLAFRVMLNKLLIEQHELIYGKVDNGTQR